MAVPETILAALRRETHEAHVATAQRGVIGAREITFRNRFNTTADEKFTGALAALHTAARAGAYEVILTNWAEFCPRESRLCSDGETRTGVDWIAYVLRMPGPPVVALSPVDLLIARIPGVTFYAVPGGILAQWTPPDPQPIVIQPLGW